jgi:CRISPR system Cascade subunit CasD
MASWGLPAVGSDRQTAVQPTRSAILGLLGAALGIKREDEPQLKALQQCVAIAIKQTVPGSLIRDYHTTQVPSNSNKIKHYTRKSELAERKLNTILSSRDYRCDGLWTVAISLTQQSEISLQALETALKNPVYPLSLGRKSCPLSVPVMPKLLESDDLKSALDTEFPSLTKTQESDRFWLRGNGQVTYFWEGNKGEIESNNVLTFSPWDEPVSRSRWQFKQRTMYQLTMSADSKGEV